MVESGELDDLVIKVLSHRERKRILKIIGSYPEGINYTGILGETGLSTGKLNYHLGELEGFLDREKDRLYRLGPLGEKAIATLEFIKIDVDPELFNAVNNERSKRLREIRRSYNIGFYTLAAIFLSIDIFLLYQSWIQSDTVLTVVTGFFILFTVAILYGTDHSRKNDPERVLWLIEWLEWKLFKGYKERK